MITKVFVMFELEESLQMRIRQVLAPFGGLLSTVPGLSLGAALSGVKQVSATEGYILTEIAEAQVVLAGGLSNEQFQAARLLKWVAVPFAGVNRLLSNPTLVNSDLTLTNSAGIMAGPMAEQVMAYILNFTRQLPQQWQAQREHHWAQGLSLTEVAGQTLGIVGYGHIGREIARRARAFDMKVVATKRTIEGDYPELDQLWPDNALNELLAVSDFVVITAPLTPETKGLMGREQFGMMKKTAYLINVARGGLIKEAELIETLQQKQIRAAALDVFEVEPLPADSPLWSLDNVIITPHTSGQFDKFRERSIEFFCQNLTRYLNQQTLLNVVDKKRGY